MKNRKTVFLGAALMALGGAGLILGNGVLAANALTAENRLEPAIIMPEEIPLGAEQAADVEMRGDSEGETYLVLRSTSSVSKERIIMEGTPLADEITAERAIETGITALAEKYALTQETLNRFTVSSQYYEVTPEAPGKHVWWVNLYPTNVDEFSEIGCYWTYIDAETGEPLHLYSAADGKG